VKLFFSKTAAPARREALIGAILLIASIALVDSLVVRNVSIGFLYFLPLLFAAGFLESSDLIGLSLACAILKEQYSVEPWSAEAAPRFLITVIAFLGAGLYMREMERRRRSAVVHATLAADQIRRREAAEIQLRSFIEGSPAAILTTDDEGRIVQANEAAHELLGCESGALPGRSIVDYLPTIGTLRQTASRIIRTSIECTGYRGGEAFSAQVWVSTFGSPESGGLGLVIFDASEQLRNREEGRLQNLTASARVILGSFWHETRNFCAALRVTAASLKRLPAVEDSEEMATITSLINGMEDMAVAELSPESRKSQDCASLRVTLDHLRIVIEPWFHDCGARVSWQIADQLPLVRGDQHALLQVFLNVARNAARVLENVRNGTFTVEAVAEGPRVLVRFRNSGPSIAHPESLFKVFQPEAAGSGIGLFVSRAITRSFGGDLRHETGSPETCFTVVLEAATWFLRAGAH
jgi:two-component system, LuxR family, sensor kinase FixL